MISTQVKQRKHILNIDGYRQHWRLGQLQIAFSLDKGCVLNWIELMRRKDIYTYLQIQVFLGSFILAKGAISVSCWKMLQEIFLGQIHISKGKSWPIHKRVKWLGFSCD